MSILKYRVWAEALISPLVVPCDSFSLSIHDTGCMIQMWCSDGIVDEFPATKVDLFTGVQDIHGADIYADDVVYLAGYGNYVCEFPFGELYEAGSEGDIGAILGNIHQNPELDV
jgi:hypothetical protein